MTEALRGSTSVLGLRAVTTTPAVMLVMLAFVPATSGTARGLLIPGLKISDIIVIALVVVVLARFSLRGPILDPVGWTILAYGTAHFLLTAINFVRRDDLHGAGVFDVAKELVSAGQYAVIFLVAVLVSRQSKSPSVWLRWTLGIASVIALIALVQELGLPGVREAMAFLTGNPHIVQPEEWADSRATGPFASWHALGIYLSIHATIAIALLFRASLSRRDRTLVSVALVCILLGLAAALTATPAALTGVALVALIPWRRLSRRSLLIVLSAFAAVLAVGTAVFWPQIVERLLNQGETVTPGIPRTIAYRLLFWTRDYFPIIGRNLWTGYGPLGPDDDIYPHTESMYVTVLMAGGIILLLIFLAFLGTAIATMSRARHQFEARSVQESLASALLVVSVFLVFAQIIHPYFDDAGGAALFTIGLGIVVGQQKRRLASTDSHDAAAPVEASGEG